MTNAMAHGERVMFEATEGFLPILTAMDIRAVGEMDAVIKFHLKRESRGTFNNQHSTLNIERWNGGIINW